MGRARRPGAGGERPGTRDEILVEAYHRGVLENLAAGPRAAVAATVGELHPQPDAPARVA